jgi:methionine biosynthesis protein MetW
MNVTGLITNWIESKSRLLDLGCGDGSLLKTLIDQLQVRGYGLEIDPVSINNCMRKGINVIEQDLNSGLKNLNDGSFDTVLMTQTLQSLRYPHLVLDEMLRIGNQAIITFPNFGHWRTRASLLFNGRMPVTKQLSHQWYDTPNIHFFTYKDFETLCVERKIKIVGRVFVGGYSSTLGLDRVWPNLFAQNAIYRLRK